VTRKIPPQAFDYYTGLGTGRSYRAVAEEFNVSKRAVVKLAQREDWAGRLEKIEKAAREKSAIQLADSLSEMNDRHLKIAKALQGKALEALRTLPLDSARDIIRALELGVRQERLALGEPTERHELLEEVIRKEYERWMVPEDEPEAPAE